MRAILSKTVIKNFGALMVLQAGTYLLPLLLIPYLVRTLSLAVYGSWMFAMAFVIIARICVSYGFDLTATRQVASIGALDQKRLSELLSDVVGARLIVWAVCLGIVTLLSTFFQEIGAIRHLLIAGMLILIGEALFPVWLFQGLERMAVITQLRLGGKFLNLLLVIFLVKSPEDVLLVPLLEAATVALSSALALWLAKNRHGVTLRIPQFARMRVQLGDGSPIFVANLAAQLYTTANMIVLGFIIGPIAVGSYSIAEKVYSALRGLLGPFVQATFPALTRMHDTSQEQFADIYKSMLLALSVILGLVGLTLFASAPVLIDVVMGHRDGPAVDALRIFAIAFPFALGGFLAPMLVVRKRNRYLMLITIAGGILGLLLSPPLSWKFGAAGAAAAFLAVQIFNSIALLIANRPSAVDRGGLA